jgi:hypothetical protein
LRSPLAIESDPTDEAVVVSVSVSVVPLIETAPVE